VRSSGLLYTLRSDGSASIGYEDYGVDVFDGCDYEVTYLLDKENFELLLKHLSISSPIGAKYDLINEFGEQFDSIKFEDFCKKHGIKYDRNIHIG
jgi:hypothetical protein